MERIKSFIKNKQKLLLAAIVLLVLALPFIVNQVLKEQDIRQRADQLAPVTVALSPASKTVNAGDSLPVAFTIDTKAYDISAIEGYIAYDSTLLELTDTASGVYTLVEGESTTEGTTISKKITLYNATATPVTGQEITAVTFNFTAKAEGTASVKFTSSAGGQFNIVASGITTAIPTDSGDPTGTYVITADTPVTDQCNVESEKPNDCVCQNNDQCTSNYCSKENSNQDGICKDANATEAPTATATEVPTATEIPTPTDIPLPTGEIGEGETGLKFNFALPGIGNGSGENTSPQRTQRGVWVTIWDDMNTEIVKDKLGAATYNSETGLYEGTVNLGNITPTTTPAPTQGYYTVKIRVDNSLYKRYQGITGVTYGTTNTINGSITLVTGDINADNSMSLEDYNAMVACYQRTSACTTEIVVLTDINDNGDSEKDNDDFNIMQIGFTIRDGD